MNRASVYIPRILKHEGGFVDHPKDPGGATNRGVTIGTLKKLGIDIDGDGDSDIADLRALPESEAVRVFKLFYADAVKADLLPVGLDYAMTDFAVNSGPSRAAKHLQRILGVDQDGDIGPKTIAALSGKSTKAIIVALSESRLRFLRGLDTWGSFGKGWQRRVYEVQADAINDADAPHVNETPKREHIATDVLTPATAPQPIPAPSAPKPAQSFLAALFAAILSLFKPKGPKA